jgi:hypothetical protein
MKYTITIKRVLEEEYEMTLDNETIMGAFDEARKLVTVRNVTSQVGRFFVSKIKEEKDE